MPGERSPGIFVSWRAFRSGRRSWLGHDAASFLAVFGNGRWERSMTIRCLFALVALSSFLGATFPASALPVATAGLWSMDAAGAFILVRKGKGHGDREERFERHRRHGAHRFSRHREHSHGMRRFNGHQGFGNSSAFAGRNQN
jgi:hypothetical protein